MTTDTRCPMTNDALIAQMRQPHAYPHSIDGPIEIHETHISIVFLAGKFAYKVKKPIKSDFLDYGSLQSRKHFCEEELRLDRRYARDLYLGVVPITRVGNRLTIQGDGEPVEYAVKMRRFPVEALLSERLESGKLTSNEVFQLAETVASFHQSAVVGDNDVSLGWPEFLVENTAQIQRTLHSAVNSSTSKSLSVLDEWLNDFFRSHSSILSERVERGFVRECHGDLHLANVVHWNDQLVPFDGIEFNEHLRWIDVLSDAAFLTMDFAARGRLDLSRSFMNAYLECSSDYGSLTLIRLFLVYRSLVRALAASMRSDELDVQSHIDLAYRFTLRETPRLWITHGLSGSGKTTLSERVVQRHEAFRLRSDIERKRLFGLAPTDRPSAAVTSKMYSDNANEQTHAHLEKLACGILRSGYSVIVDATFLKRRNRSRFQKLAAIEGVAYSILDCHCDNQTLRQRVADRLEENEDASDADLDVLEKQIANHEPLSESEQEFVVEIPDIVQVAEHL